MRKNVVFCLGLSLFVSPVFAADPEGGREAGRRAIIERAETPDIIGPRPGDEARDLVDHYAVWNLGEMEARGLLSAALDKSPWTDSYWPTYMGGIANRYGDPKFQNALSWKDKERYLRRMQGRGEMEQLSPAEKYDLLMGDDAFTLTNGIIAAAAQSVDRNGQIESWFGLCHGWAAASFMLPRPAKSVTVSAPDGREIVFTPSDLKALGTLLWANAAGRTKFVGGRCNERSPGRDGRNREIDPECFDNNPATWHLAMVNQIGVAKRSFVLDADEGSEVWNQPMYSYGYRYENPLTQLSSPTLGEAKVALKDFKRDPYGKFRSPEADSVVNIIATVSYLSESSPSLASTDGPENDLRSGMTLDYDLELDRDGNIVGGEWHSSNHPDFLWVPVAGSRAHSVGDDGLWRAGDRTIWLRHLPVPSVWRQAALVSAKRQQPLAAVVEALFDESSR